MQVYGAGGKTVPKSGRLATGSFHGTGNSPIPGSPFPAQPDPRFLRQTFGSGFEGGDTHLVMPDNRVVGTQTRSSPLGTQRNTSTLVHRIAVQTQAGSNNTRLTLNQPGHGKNRHNIILMPHEKHTFFLRKPQPIQKTQFGASKSHRADTAFHPIIKKPYKPTLNKTPVLGERTHAASFNTRNHTWYDPNNSYKLGKVNVGSNQVGTGRWQTVKRGAAG